MKKLLACALVVLFAAPAASAFDLFRSLSGALGGGNKQEQAQGGAVTATIGVRGLLPQKIAASQPAPQDVRTAEKWRVTARDAEGEASRHKLVARQVSLSGDSGGGSTSSSNQGSGGEVQ